MFTRLADLPNPIEPLSSARGQFCALHGDYFPQTEAAIDVNLPGRYFCAEAVATITADPTLTDELVEAVN